MDGGRHHEAVGLRVFGGLPAARYVLEQDELIEPVVWRAFGVAAAVVWQELLFSFPLPVAVQLSQHSG